MDQRRCPEGFGRILLFGAGRKQETVHSSTGKRTDQCQRQVSTSQARNIYRKPRIGAVAEMTGAQVAAGIYSTSTGEFVCFMIPDDGRLNGASPAFSPQT